MRSYLLALVVGVASIALGGRDTQTAVATGVGGMQPPGTGVMPRPVTGTPHFGATDSKPVEQVRQLVQCGGTMYAVGSFSRILQRGRVFKRHNVFSFRATSPFTVRSWAPNVDGTVNSIAFRRGKCSHAYIG